MLNNIFLVLIISFSIATGAYAQSGRPTKGTDVRTSTMQVELPTPVAETPVPLMGGGGEVQTLNFVTPDANFDRAFVKDAPFSAESITEHVQTLSDGNRMVRKSSAKLYRDGAGRTRRDHEMRRAPRPDGEARLIVITDHVGNVNYIIDTTTRIARARKLPPRRVMEAMQRAQGGPGGFGVLMPTSAVRRREAQGDAAPEPPKPAREKLGSQVIEGVLAEGTRTTVTIPAGEFDNEQPMVISHEEWYAPELQMIVLMKHNDPRFGETTFKLTNILRAEPAPEMFQPPAGYKVVDTWPDFSRPGTRVPQNP